MEGLTLDQLDHQFIGQGDPHVESIRLQAQYEQNLTPEEMKRMKMLAPAVEEFFLLDYKGKTGQLPELDRETPIDQISEDEQMDLEEYARMQNIPQDEIDNVMSDIVGPREEIALNMNDAIPPSVPNQQPVVENRQELALGTDNLQQQEQIQGMPPVQEVLPGAGTGLIQDPMDANASPVADTVPMDNVEEGSAIINAAAVRIVGLKDLLKAREEVREILRAQGVVIDDEQQYQGDGVDIATSNGEFKFSAKEVEVLGQETIDKWNKKGEAQTEIDIANEQAQNPNQVGVQPVMGAREGMIVENPPPPQQKPYNMKYMGAFPAESPDSNMETYYTDNRTLTTGKDAGKEGLFNLARNMPLGMDRETFLATMAVFGESGGDPDSLDAVAHVIRNRKEVAQSKGKGSELWQKGLEEQINNNEWNALGPKGKGYEDIMIKGRDRREEFMNIDRESLYKRVDAILNNPNRNDPTEGRTFYIKRNRVDDNLAPLNIKGAGQQYFVKEFNSGNLFDPKQIGDHVFYRYKH
tara:strand:- start:143 stop:1714 length:1572 start_codon:yes stop_codon:yes gene_type:complete